MWSKEEFIKKQKLTILVFITVIFALIFLGPSQALSDKPGWEANCLATFTDDIKGTADVKWQGRDVSTQRFQFDNPPPFFYGDVELDFDGENFSGDDYNYSGPKVEGFLRIILGKREESDRFVYTWNDEGEEAIHCSLMSPGDFTYDKKLKTFEFIVSENQCSEILCYAFPTPPVDDNYVDVCVNFTIFGELID